MLRASDVSVVIPTRGDHDLTKIVESLSAFREVLIWNNAERLDVGAYGRYSMIEYASSDVILAQDDDCLVDPVDQQRLLDAYEPGVLTALMPPSRNDYTDTVLVGWGALFDGDLPLSAFRRWRQAGHLTGNVLDDREFLVVGADFVFPMLTPWKRLDAEHEDLPWAHAENRTWASYPDYAAVKERYLREARALRDKEQQ